MPKYDYIKIRVNEIERAQLQAMVDDGEVSTLSDAARKIIFAPQLNDCEKMDKCLQEIAAAHQDLCVLVRSALDGKELFEADVVRMERNVAEMARSVAKLSAKKRGRS